MLDKGYLPTREVAPLLRRFVEENFDSQYDAAAGTSLPRTLYRWEHEQDRVKFQTVDDLFCSLGHIHWWEPISDLYFSVNLIDHGPVCARPGCGRRFDPRGKGPTRKKWCSQRCSRTMAMQRYRAKQPKPPKLLSVECKNGHRRTKANTRYNKKGHKVCLDCRRPLQREWARSKRATA